MVESAETSNLPLGVGVNNTLVSPTKSRMVSVILINNNNHNIWIRQPLYAGDLWEVSPREWKYEPVLARNRDTNEIKVNFVQVSPEDLQQDILTNNLGCGKEMGESTKESSKCEEEENPHLELHLTLSLISLTLKRNWKDSLLPLTSGKHHRI